jgi:hypothetical protein
MKNQTCVWRNIYNTTRAYALVFPNLNRITFTTRRRRRRNFPFRKLPGSPVTIDVTTSSVRDIR